MGRFRVNGVTIAFILAVIVGAVIDLVTNSIIISAATAFALGAIAIPAVFIYSSRIFNKPRQAGKPVVRNVEIGGSHGVQIGGGNTQLNYFGRRDSSGIADVTVSGETPGASAALRAIPSRCPQAGPEGGAA